MPVHYITYQQIDKSKWDNCIDTAANGLVYGYSFYLDAMAKHWDALVLDDYEAVMPLTWRKKFGIRYLYQPAFTQQLGIFYKGTADAEMLIVGKLGSDAEQTFRLSKNIAEKKLIRRAEKKFVFIGVLFNFFNGRLGRV